MSRNDVGDDRTPSKRNILGIDSADLLLYFGEIKFDRFDVWQCFGTMTAASLGHRPAMRREHRSRSINHVGGDTGGNNARIKAEMPLQFAAFRPLNSPCVPPSRSRRRTPPIDRSERSSACPLHHGSLA
jgi:hypothetical protein